MATAAWEAKGEYMETCTCDYLCPCPESNLTARHTKGHCDFAMVFHIEKGRYAGTRLDDLSFVVVGHAPGPSMSDGNITVGLIIDERASAEQREALVQIGSGQAGGPMAALGPLVGTFAGAETKPIRFHKEGMTCDAFAPGVLDQAVEGVPSPVKEGEPLYLDNTVHPANPRLALAKAKRSHLHIFGIKWDEESGRNNGHYASFNWRSA